MAETIDGRVALTIPQAAEALDCSESTVRRLMDQGKLTWARVGADKRVTAQSILAMLPEGDRGNQEDPEDVRDGATDRGG
tara:strand:+ start:205 stop:444 length:240 start_codon:yes stop_codon:yes gene_type:complete